MGTADVRLQSPSGLLVDLADVGTYGIAPGSDIGIAEPQITYGALLGQHFAIPSVIGYTEDRQLQINIHIQGGTIDAWTNVFNDIDDILLDARRYYNEEQSVGNPANLTIKLDSMSEPVEFDVLGGYVDARELLTLTDETPIMLDVPVYVIVKPLGRPPQKTLVASSQLNNGNDFYTFASVESDEEMPVSFSLEMNATTGSSNKLIFGRRTKGDVSKFIFTMECESGSYAGYTTTVSGAHTTATFVRGADAHGSAVVNVQTTGGGPDPGPRVCIWELNDDIIEFTGRYRVYLRFYRANTNNLTGCTFTLKFGGVNGSDIANAAVSFDDNGLTEFPGIFALGEIDIPVTSFPLFEPTTSYKFSLFIQRRASIIHDFDLDCIYLMPIDEVAGDFEFPNSIVANEFFLWDSLRPGILPYLLDTTGNFKHTNIVSIDVDSRPELEPNRAQIWCFLVAKNGTNKLKQHFLNTQHTMRFEYFTLHRLVR